MGEKLYEVNKMIMVKWVLGQEATMKLYYEDEKSKRKRKSERTLLFYGTAVSTLLSHKEVVSDTKSARGTGTRS